MGDVWPTKPKFAGTQQHSIIQRKWSKFSWSLLLLHYLLYPRLAPVALCSVLYDQLSEQEKTWAWFIWFCMIYRYHLHVDSYSTRAFSFSEHLWRRWKKILPELNECRLFAWEENWLDVWLNTSPWALANGLAGRSVTWEEYDWKNGNKVIWGRGMWIDLWMGKKCAGFCVPCDHSPKSNSVEEEDINNQVDRMTCSVDSSWPLSPRHKVSCLLQEVFMGSRFGGDMCLGAHHQVQLQLWSLLECPVCQQQRPVLTPQHDTNPLTDQPAPWWQAG